MNILITADVHLSLNYPERFNNLKRLFNYAKENKISHFIIAGDLFDKDFSVKNLKQFNELVKQYSDIQTFIIPGNHDKETNESLFSYMDNLKVFNKTTLETIDNIFFLFIPYKDNSQIVKEIIPYKKKLITKKWILVSHGDYSGSQLKDTGINESGYFPLYKRDIEKYNPAFVFLGHIHQPDSPIENILFYPGSPFPIDKGEYGIRKFILFNTETFSVEFITNKTKPIYIKEKINIIPISNYEKYLNLEINKIKKKWEASGIPEDWLKNIYLTLEIKGYVYDKNSITKWIKENGNEILQTFNIELNDEELSTTNKTDYEEFLLEFKKLIENIKTTNSKDYLPDKNDIILAGEELIYEN